MLSHRPLILLIVLLSVFGPISTDMYLAGLPIMVADFATTEALMNMSLYLFMLIFAFSILLMGPISDKYGRRRVLVISLFVYTAACFACSFAPNVYVFIAMRIVQALGAGGSLTSAFALIKDCFEGKDRASTLSVTAALGVLGPMLSPVVGAGVIELVSWRATFWVTGGISLLCLFLSLGLSPTIPEIRQKSVTSAVLSVFSILKDRNFLKFMIMMTVFLGSQLAYISVSSYVYQNDFGIGGNQYSLALAATSLAGLIISVAIRRTKWFTTNRILMTLLIFGIASTVMMYTVAKDSWVLFLISMIPCCSIIVTERSFGYAILMNKHDGDNGAVSSILNFSSFMFGFLGMMVASSFPPDYFILGISAVLTFSCIAYIVCWLLLRKDWLPR